MRTVLQSVNVRVPAIFSLLALTVLSPAQSEKRHTPVQRRMAVEAHLSRYIHLEEDGSTGLGLQSEMRRLQVPAVSVATVTNGQIDWAKAYGDEQPGKPATASTLFEAASIAKAVTAFGVLKLVQEGRLSLDQDVNLFLKRCQIPENQFTREHKVTVRELLSHTSGIGSHHGRVYKPKETPSLIQIFKGKLPARTPPVRVEAVPGSRFACSNGGYLVLSILIEDITGESFAQYMKRTVLDPIGMRNSTFQTVLSPKQIGHAAWSYDDSGNAVPPQEFAEPNLAAGGLWSTPTDLARFLLEVQREYDGKSNKVLNADTVRTMLNPGTRQDRNQPWGLGFETEGTPEAPFIRHGGSAYFQSDMILYLRGSGVVVMTNSFGGSALAEEVFRSAAHVYNFPDFRTFKRTAIAVDSKTFPRFVGTYGFIKVGLSADGLNAEIPLGTAPQRLYASSPLHFFVLDGPQELIFSEESDGSINKVEFATPMTKMSLHRSSALPRQE